MKTLKLVLVAFILIMSPSYSFSKSKKFTLSDENCGEYKELGTAIANGKNKKVKELLASGISANEPQQLMTPLGIAVETNNVEAVKMLLENGADVDKFYTQTSYGAVTLQEIHPPIVGAINVGNPEVMKLLLDKNAEVDFVYEHLGIEYRLYVELRSTPLIDAFVNLGKVAFDDKKGYNGFDVKQQYEQLKRVLDATEHVDRIMSQHTNPCAPGNKPYPSQIPDMETKTSLAMYAFAVAERNAKENIYLTQLGMALADRVDKNYKYQVPTADIAAAAAAVGTSHLLAGVKIPKIYVRNIDLCTQNEDLLAYMLNNGWNIETENDGGAQFFTKLNDAATIEMLVERGVDINVANAQQQTIMYNVLSDLELLETCLKLGGDPYFEGAMGLKPTDFLRGVRPSVRKKAEALIAKYAQ